MQLQVGDRLTDETVEYEVIGRPYTTNAGKSAHVRVKRVEFHGLGVDTSHTLLVRAAAYSIGRVSAAVTVFAASDTGEPTIMVDGTA